MADFPDEKVARYKKEAKRIIPLRVAFYAQRFGLTVNSVRITSARKRWGSCGTKGNLNFTWRLVMTPIPIIDYVVAHELSHLAHRNHSRAFWNSVQTIAPHFKEAKKWLRQNQRTLLT